MGSWVGWADVGRWHGTQCQDPPERSPLHTEELPGGETGVGPSPEPQLPKSGNLSRAWTWAFTPAAPAPCVLLRRRKPWDPT